MGATIPWRLLSEHLALTYRWRYHDFTTLVSETYWLLWLICKDDTATPFAVFGMNDASNGLRTMVVSEGQGLEKGIGGEAEEERK